MNSSNTGLVLSGGGIRGVAHIGAIKALEEFEIHPTHIAGTSAGAIVGALYAGGISWEEILDFFKTTSIFQTRKYARNKPGFVDTEKFYDDFKRLLPHDNFNALEKALYVTATDIIKGSLKVFNSGELIAPVLASASFPGVFTPTKIANSYYIDGGVLNNFPVELLQPECSTIIGVYVNPLNTITPIDLKHSYNVVERAYKIKMAADSITKFNTCDIIISPLQLNTFNTFSMSKINEIFDIGYINAKRTIETQLAQLRTKQSII